MLIILYNQFIVGKDKLKWFSLKIAYQIRKIIGNQPPFEGKHTPIIINNYNRLSYLRELIDQLKSLGYTNLYIIDNDSTYPPLLEYYDSNPCKVYRLNKNLGHLSFWKSGIYNEFKNQYFVYTDSDILLNSDCPDNFMEILYENMKKYKASKAGFALKIDDLPDHFENKNKVKSWEKRFWTKSVEDNIYLARIDTTFALHYPNLRVGSSAIGNNLRIGGNLEAKHQPWYIDSTNLSDEEVYYIETCNKSASWAQFQKKVN